MGRYFSLALNLGPQVQAKPKPKKTKAFEIDAIFWIVFFLVFFSIAYLTMVNSTSTKGYEIKKLESRLLELKEQQKRLELEAASLKSIQTIEEEIKTLNLIPSGSVKYPDVRNGFAYQ